MSGKERLRLRAHDGCGECICRVSSEDRFPFLDRTVEPTCPLVAHSARVSAVAFSPTGRTIATGGSDTAVILWDAESGKGVLTPKP